ncbi:unnamed protein product [Blumeria hordei]|uniref:Uncharacterized protein n=1 Tax=Blumeria hordei TaxID=2867405 RepID=A0A383UVU2_BLUHO|nr:unnamed protein product [Blumeria hordei]
MKRTQGHGLRSPTFSRPTSTNLLFRHSSRRGRAGRKGARSGGVMSSLAEKSQPQIVVDAVLKRAEVGKIGRTLKTRLAFAQFKVMRGWEDLSIDAIEPKVQELRQHMRADAKRDFLPEDSDMKISSDQRQPQPRHPLGSRFRNAIDASRQTITSESRAPDGSCGKRRNEEGLGDPSCLIGSRKRYCSSPLGHPHPYQDLPLTQSSPIKPPHQAHFTTTVGPGLSFYADSYRPRHLLDGLLDESEEDEVSLPLYSFNINSSPPRTPPLWPRENGERGCEHFERVEGEENEGLFQRPAFSPPAVDPTRLTCHPQTPPRHATAPSLSRPISKAEADLLCGPESLAPASPTFDFSDFVNITPSPARPPWPLTPQTDNVPGAFNHRHPIFHAKSSPRKPNIPPGPRDPREVGHSRRGQYCW